MADVSFFSKQEAVVSQQWIELSWRNLVCWCTLAFSRDPIWQILVFKPEVVISQS